MIINKNDGPESPNSESKSTALILISFQVRNLSWIETVVARSLHPRSN